MKLNFSYDKKSSLILIKQFNDMVFSAPIKGKNKTIKNLAKKIFKILIKNLSSIVNKKKLIGEFSVEFLEDTIKFSSKTKKTKGIKETIFNCNEISEIKQSKNFLFIVATRTISIPFTAFHSEEELKELLDFLELKLKEKSLNKDKKEIGFLTEAEFEKLDKEDLEEYYLTESHKKKSYITKCCYHIYNKNKHWLAINVFWCIFIIGCSSMYALLTILDEFVLDGSNVLRLILFLVIATLIFFRFVIFKKIHSIKKMLKNSISTDDVEVKVLATEKRLLTKINDVCYEFNTDDIKKVVCSSIGCSVIISNSSFKDYPIHISSNTTNSVNLSNEIYENLYNKEKKENYLKKERKSKKYAILGTLLFIFSFVYIINSKAFVLSTFKNFFPAQYEDAENNKEDRLKEKQDKAYIDLIKSLDEVFKHIN